MGEKVEVGGGGGSGGGGEEGGGREREIMRVCVCQCMREFTGLPRRVVCLRFGWTLILRFI